jgi:uncharacterized Rmd1/YagE family protein
LARIVNWHQDFEDDYGPLEDFVNGFQTVFSTSPTTDLIRLKQEAKRHTSHGPVPLRSLSQGLNTSFRRPTKPHMRSEFFAKLGCVAYSSVAEAIDVAELEGIYRQRGLDTRVIEGEVLHVSDRSFSFFVFDNGAVVWWGKDQRHHWMIENDFFTRQTALINKHVPPLIKHPHPQHIFEDVPFPVWCSWSLKKVDADDAVEAFEKDLLFDHFTILESDETEDLKLAVSFALADAAKLDYSEHVLKKSTEVNAVKSKIRSLPESVSVFYSYRDVRKAEGALSMNRVLLRDIDESNFLWEHPWLKTFRDLTRDQLSVLQRLTFIEAQMEALTESLELQDNAEHRLFMIKSDWILIMILAVDMILMLMRLIVTLYFVEPTKDDALLL